jgi:hypothetical protein
MFHNCKQERITVIQLGFLETEEVRRALLLANQAQHPFYYDLHPSRLPLSDKYKLPNGGFDLCKATKDLVYDGKYKKLPRPLVLITSAPLGEPDHGNENEYFFFYSQEVNYDPKVSIISTYPWKKLPKHRTLQHYIFLMLATDLMSRYVDLQFHGEGEPNQDLDNLGCLLHYCNELEDAEQCLQSGSLCRNCMNYVLNAIRQGIISVEWVAAIMRIYHKATNRKHCFVIMPFKQEMMSVYDAVSIVLEELGWKVTRADRMPFPNRITTTIIMETLTSDLVIADLTGGNPNVFYEMGVTHSIGQNLITIIQKGDDIPFDLKDEATIFYTKDEEGLRKLQQDIRYLIV